MPFTNFEPIKESCNSPEHNPPTMQVLQPGTHTWTCPACGESQTFTVKKVTC